MAQPSADSTTVQQCDPVTLRLCHPAHLRCCTRETLQCQIDTLQPCLIGILCPQVPHIIPQLAVWHGSPRAYQRRTYSLSVQREPNCGSNSPVQRWARHSTQTNPRYLEYPRAQIHSISGTTPVAPLSLSARTPLQPRCTDDCHTHMAHPTATPNENHHLSCPGF